MSDGSHRSRSAPTQVRASFSRPTTAADGELSECGGEPRGILITELNYSGAEEEITEQREKLTQETICEQEEEKALPDLEEDKSVTDIFDEKAWDTDLESDDEKQEDESPFKLMYSDICEKYGCSPITYFQRHMEDKDIHMKHHGINSLESVTLANILKAIVCVEELDLEGNWLRQGGCKHLCRMLEENDSIQRLNLSENELGADGAGYISKMLRSNHTLHSLSLAANHLGDHSVDILAESLEDSHLTDLDLSKNSFGDHSGVVLGPILASNDHLETLDLSWNKIRTKGGISIAKGLKENVRLKVVNLAWNGLGEAGGIALADALIANNTITDLDISANRLTMNVAQKFVKTINVNDTLEVLKLSRNPISTAGAVALVTSLDNSTTSIIHTLYLEENPVEFEFLEVLKSLKSKRDVTVTYGSVLRAGNTSYDLGKRAIDPYGKSKKPVMVLEEHLVINKPQRLRELLQKHYPESAAKQSCLPEELTYCLQIMEPSLNSKHLQVAVSNIPRDHTNRISFSGLA